MEESRLKQEADSKKAGERMDTDTNQRNFICFFFIVLFKKIICY
jgi:hypothetical protein